MNETLDTVEQRHKQETSLDDLKQPDPSGGPSGPIGSCVPMSPSPPAVKRSSVVDLWRMREIQNSNEGGVVVGSISKKKAAISEETFRSLLKSPTDTGNVNPGSSSPLISKKSAEGSEEKKDDDDCNTNIAASSIDTSVTRSPPRIVPSTSSPKIPLVKRTPHASQSVAPVSDLTILPATSSVSASSVVDSEKRTSKIASIWEKMSTSFDSSSTVPTAKLTKDERHEPSNEEKSHLQCISDAMSVNVKESPPPPKRHSVVDIWNNRNSGGKSVENVAAKIPPKPFASTNLPQRRPSVPSISHIPDQVSSSPQKPFTSYTDALPEMAQEGKSEDSPGNIQRISGFPEAAPCHKETGQDQCLNRNEHLADHMASNTPDLNEPSLGIQGTRRSVVDRYKVHASTVSTSSVVKTVSPVVSSIVKEHSSRIPVGTFRNNKSGRGSEVLSYPTPPQNEKNTEMNVTVSAARNAIESAVTSVVDKHIEQRGNKASDRWTLNKAPSPKGEKFSADTFDLPKTHGKVTDRWKPHSSSVSESGNKFDKEIVAGLLKMHSANTPFGRGRHVKDRNDEPNVMQNVSPSKRSSDDSPIVCASSSLNSEHVPAVSLKSSSNMAPDQESLSNHVPTSPPSNIDDAFTTSTVSERNVSIVCENPSEAEKSPDPSSKVSVADRWKKRLVEAKEYSLEQESNVVRVDDACVSIKPDVSNRATTDVENSTKRNGFVGIQEKSISDQVDPTPPELLVKPSLSVVDYAAKLRSARAPPSFLPAARKVPDLVHPKKHIQAKMVESTSSMQLSHNVVDDELPSQHRDVSVPHRLESTGQDHFVSAVQFVQEGNQNVLLRPTRSKVMSVNLPNQTLEENIESVTSSGIQGENIATTKNSSAFAPWHIVPEKSTEGDVSKNCFTPRGLQDIGKPKNSEPLHQIDRQTSISTLYSPETRHPVEKVLPNNDSSRPPISLSTKKLASDRALNKKRLQQYRGKAKKATIAKISSSEALSHENGSRRDLSLEEKVDHVVSVSNLQSSQGKSSFDFDGLLRSSGTATERFGKPDVEDEVFAAICSTSSTTSSSPLASKAEKMLQDRRKRSNGQHRKRVEEPSQCSRRPQSFFNCYDINDTDDVGEGCTTQFPEDVTEDGQPRLFTRYNTSSRFMDVEASQSAPEEVVYDSETVDSSFNETETTGSNSGYFGLDRQFVVEEKKEAPERRKAPVKDPPGQMSDEKSVNLSSQSAWDSDWGGSISMVSLDFNKLASAVDEQVAAFRDFVGVTSKKPPKSSKVKSHLKPPSTSKAPPEVEDVAIEVEYVEDSFDDENPRVGLGFCTAPIDYVVRGSLDFSFDSKASISRKFTEPCSGMLPTGEPSYERKPTGRKHSHRNGYV
jgi:hypothetical protein